MFQINARQGWLNRQPSGGNNKFVIGDGGLLVLLQIPDPDFLFRRIDAKRFMANQDDDAAFTLSHLRRK
ncbi:MAG: hypothetical protein A4E62_03109 [Syntrophorhabdus sp. PtaU1.Bin002]|nr:MAG: hypothetical protein A4E62_03109 [Syntrophorhabdus sp. PtaU1.Bin002]